MKYQNTISLVEMSQRKLLEGNSQNYFDKDESESLKLIKYWPNPKN